MNSSLYAILDFPPMDILLRDIEIRIVSRTTSEVMSPCRRRTIGNDAHAVLSTRSQLEKEIVGVS